MERRYTHSLKRDAKGSPMSPTLPDHTQSTGTKHQCFLVFAGKVTIIYNIRRGIALFLDNALPRARGLLRSGRTVKPRSLSRFRWETIRCKVKKTYLHIELLTLRLVFCSLLYPAHPATVRHAVPRVTPKMSPVSVRCLEAQWAAGLH